MERTYIKVTPSRESLNPDDIVANLSALHKLTAHGQDPSLSSRLNPLEESNKDVPEFEFLVLSQGKDAPVEFLYGTSEDHLQSLKNRITTAYPASFDVEIVDVDLLEKLIPPERYAPADFVKKIENGELLVDDDATGSPDDISGGHTETTSQADENHRPDSDPDEFSAEDHQAEPSESTAKRDKRPEVARPSETTRQVEPEDAVTSAGQEQTISPEQIDGYEMLEEIDAGLLDVVDLPEQIDAEPLETKIDGPTWTEEGDILARPTLEHGEPITARWNGAGKRKKDWMTTMKMFSKIAEPEQDDIQDRAPLASLIQYLAGSDLPIAFQVVFKRIESWEDQAERRKDNLHLNRDTLGQKISYEIGEILNGSTQERRRERRRDPMEDIGESVDQNSDSPITGDVGKRQKLIDNKIPDSTFRVNVRAVSVANDEVPVSNVKQTMNDLASVLNHLDGYFYGVEPEILENGAGFRNKQKATEEFHRFVNREIISGSGKVRPDLVLNADELANFLTVPSSKNLTVEGVRGTRAEAEARDPLAKPDPDLMKEFHKSGMGIGYALDKEAEREPVPTQVPPSLLTQHYGRFATTGAGKSKALINDILSLHENTDGPTILVDPKGDGMTENYLKAHFERFGEDSLKEDVIHYPIPDILPGFTFFNINPALNQGRRRGDAIQNKADHYQELLKLVMGRENYEDSKVAPTMISALIKALFDEHYVENVENDDETPAILADRESANKFTHRQLEKLTKQVRMYGADEGGKIPNVSDEAVRDTLEEQAEGDSRPFATIMNAVFNRLNYIREDEHLRRIFNNTEPKFDFRDHLYDNKVILFDLGDLRDDATMIMTGLILTNLWDSLQGADRTVCTQGHNSIEECRERARKNGLDPQRPHCREPWPDDHLVNLIIDEAASVADSSILNKMLEQGRSFHLSVGLSMQFPEQMKNAGTERTYQNVLNNVATKLIGKIRLDDEMAQALAHEGMDITEFENRINALPRGEWIAQLPSPNFMETGPEPFSLEPLPIPSGHPESEFVLKEEARQRFEHVLDNQVHRRTQEKYGTEPDEYEDQTPTERAIGVDTDLLSSNGSDKPEQSSTDKGDSESSTWGGRGRLSLSERERDPSSLPEHIIWKDDPGVYECVLCESDYLPKERADAIRCCEREVESLVDEYGNPDAIESVDGKPGYTTTRGEITRYGETHTVRTTVKDEELAFDTGEQPAIADGGTLTHEDQIKRWLTNYEEVTYGAMLSAIVAAIPPQYHSEREGFIEWCRQHLESRDELTARDTITTSYLRELIHQTPPADIDIDGEALVQRLTDDTTTSEFDAWEAHEQPGMRRFYSHPRPVAGLRLKRTGEIGAAYSPAPSAPIPASSGITQPECPPLPSEDHLPTNQSLPLKKVGVDELPQSHLNEYNVTAEEAAFLRAIVKAMNRDLEGYTLTESMTGIKHQYDANPGILIKQGYLEQHTGVNNRTYYSVTPEGQKACDTQRQHGRDIGDLGDKTPHRVGSILAKQYYASQNAVERVEMFAKDSGNEFDLKTFDEDGSSLHIIEVEAGRTTADDPDSDTKAAGLNDYESIRKDYDLLADSGGESVWVVRNSEIAVSVLRALESGDKIEVSRDNIDKILNWNISLEELNHDILPEDGGDGLDSILTYKQLRDLL